MRLASWIRPLAAQLEVRVPDVAMTNRLRLRSVAPSVAFSIWALTFGTRALMNTAVATTQLGITDGFEMVRDVSNLVFDSIQWRSLSTAWS